MSDTCALGTAETVCHAHTCLTQIYTARVGIRVYNE